MAMDNGSGAQINEVEICKSFGAGYFMQVACRQHDGSYKSAIGKQVVHIHPSSVLFASKVETLIYNELTVTSRNYMRTCSAVMGEWLAPFAKRH